MARFNPNKLHVRFQPGTTPVDPVVPRRYTLTHSDRTRDMFLTIGSDYDAEQIGGRYTRLKRDEVLAEWQQQDDDYQLHVYVHVSGGRVLGSARHRFRIFQHELPFALQAVRTGDSWLYRTIADLDSSEVVVHFASTQAKYNLVEPYGTVGDYQVAELSITPGKRLGQNLQDTLSTGASKVGNQSFRRHQ